MRTDGDYQSQAPSAGPSIKKRLSQEELLELSEFKRISIKSRERSAAMCDYSLEHHESRAACLGDELVTKKFSNSPSRGFCAPAAPSVAVCLLPGTELKFKKPIRLAGLMGLLVPFFETDCYLARFRRINLESEYRRHDALELENGRFILLNDLRRGQHATVLQLPVIIPELTENTEEPIPEMAM
jgi:hypothetical protein